MGLSRKAFEITNGFSDMRAGEDIDLTFRLWEAGFETQLIDRAFVYHKRRNTISSFFHQTFAFGTARPVLNRKYPSTKKMTYWFPSLFILGFDTSILLLIFGFWQLSIVYAIYFIALFSDATVENKSVKVGFLSIITSFTQFIGYGFGFLQSQFTKK
jgi:GT2 family glycosyltransferase